MKTTNTIAPKLSSLNDNSIRDLFSIGYLPYEVRILALAGSLVRLEINKDGYVELQSTEDVDLSKYNEMLNGLMEFFYGNAYLYGVVNQAGSLELYDIFTNDNFLSTKDMMYLNKNYGLPIAQPQFEGHLSFSELSGTLYKMVKDYGYDEESLFILPSVYINDKRSSSSYSEEVKTEVILGQKKTYPAWNGNYSATSEASISKTTEFKKNKEVLKVFELSDKSQREQIFNETYKNISEYLNKITLTKEEEDWWLKNGKTITHLYAIHTLPSTRKIVYDYSAEFYLPYYDYNKSNNYKWTALFLEMFDELYYNDILRGKFQQSFRDYIIFEKIFTEELETFNKFYEAEGDTKYDWRLGENWVSDFDLNFKNYNCRGIL